MSQEQSKSPPQKIGIFSKLFGTLFFFIFFALGSFFLVLIIKESYKTISSYFWEKSPARIQSSDIKRHLRDSDDGTPYELQIFYTYTFDSQEYKSTTITNKESRYSSYEKAYKISRKFPVHTNQTCFVNPKEPSQVILIHGSLWLLLFILLPLVFIIIGGGGIYAIWIVKDEDPTKTKSLAKDSQEKKKLSSGKVLKYFGIIFTLVGGGFSCYFASQFFYVYAAQTWQSVNARVIDSDVLRSESRDSDGNTSVTYSVDIFYEYYYQGQTYRSSRYDFFTFSSSGRDSKKAIVREYRPGELVTAYVNPKDPSQAVLYRGFSWNYLLGLLPLIFLLAGLAMLRASLKKAAYEGHAYEAQLRPKITSSKTMELKTSASPLGKFMGILICTLFWNGIVSFFVYQAFKSYARGRPEWFLIIFIIPFVLVGTLLIFLTFHEFLSIFNPRISLVISSSDLHLGDTVQLNWKVNRNASRLNELKIKLCGREEITYKSDDSTRNEKYTFYDHVIIKQPKQASLVQGSIQMRIPPDSMHTFSAESNKITWCVNVEGDIKNWPNVNNEYPLKIEPVRI